MGNNLDIRFATISDAEPVTALRKRTAVWLESIDQPLWRPDTFSLEETRKEIDSNQLVVGFSTGRLAASMRIIPEDPEFWPEATPGEAFYLHKIVIDRDFAGQNMATGLIMWAGQYARSLGRKALRLDCAPREKLMNIYAKAEFSPVDQDPVAVRGFLVRRMELNCG